MKFSVMNGWKDAPHCWWRYLLFPFSFDRMVYNGYRNYSFGFFGFVFWVLL